MSHAWTKKKKKEKISDIYINSQVVILINCHIQAESSEKKRDDAGLTVEQELDMLRIDKFVDCGFKTSNMSVLAATKSFSHLLMSP